MAEEKSVSIFIPFPLPDPLEGEIFREYARSGSRGPAPISARDFNYIENIRAVRQALERLGLDIPEEPPKPVMNDDGRFCVLTVQLARGLTAETIQRALPGFKIE